MTNKIQEHVDKIGHACQQCGSTNDFMVLFTDHPICGRCVRKNHARVVNAK